MNKNDSSNRVDYKMSESGRISIFAPDKNKKLPALKQAQETTNDASAGTEKTIPMSPELSPRTSSPNGKKKKGKVTTSPRHKSPKRSTKRTTSGSGKSPKKSPSSSSRGDRKSGLGSFLKTSPPKKSCNKEGDEEKSMWETIADDDEFARLSKDLQVPENLGGSDNADEDDDINSVGPEETKDELVNELPQFNDDNPDLDKSLTLKTGEASMGFEDIFVGSDDDYDEKDIEQDIMETTTPPPSPTRVARKFEREESLRMDDLFGGGGGQKEDVGVGSTDKKKKGVSRTKSGGSKKKKSISTGSDASPISGLSSPRKKSSRRRSSTGTGQDNPDVTPDPPVFIEFDSSDTNLDLMQHQKKQQKEKGPLSPVRETDTEDSPKKKRSSSQDVRRDKSSQNNISSAISGPPLEDGTSPRRGKSRTKSGDMAEMAKRSRSKSKSRRKSRTTGGDHHSSANSSFNKSQNNKDSTSRRKSRTTGGEHIESPTSGKSRRKSRTTGGDLNNGGRDTTSRRKSRTTGGDMLEKSPSKDSPSKRKSRTAGGDVVPSPTSRTPRTPSGKLGSPSWGAVVHSVSEEKRANEAFDKAVSASAAPVPASCLVSTAQHVENANWPDCNSVITGPQQAAGATTAEHHNRQSPGSATVENDGISTEDDEQAEEVVATDQEKSKASSISSSSKRTQPGMGAKILSMASLKAASLSGVDADSIHSRKASRTGSSPPKILVVISSRNPNRAVKFHQRWAFTILDSLNIDYYIMDADDPSNKDKDVVEQLYAVSGMPDVFPQFFTSRDSQDQEDPDFTFKGNWGWLDAAHENGILPSALFT